MVGGQVRVFTNGKGSAHLWKYIWCWLFGSQLVCLSCENQEPTVRARQVKAGSHPPLAFATKPAALPARTPACLPSLIQRMKQQIPYHESGVSSPKPSTWFVK